MKREFVVTKVGFTEDMLRQLREKAESGGLTFRELDLTLPQSGAVLRDCEVFVGHCPRELLKGAERLRWIQLNSAGVDDMADPAIYPHGGITVTNASGVFGVSIAEHMLMGVLMLYRRYPVYARQQREKLWRRAEGLRLFCGSRVTVFGTGDLGSTFARYCGALGAEVTGVSRSGKEKPDFLRVYPVSQRLEALAGADVVALCLPGTGETAGLFDRACFGALKPGAILVNTGRGRTVDEQALIEALREKKLSGAVLDVFQTEPLPAASPLWDMENVILTPHMSGSGWDSENIYKIFDLVMDNLDRYLSGAPLRNVVDVNLGY